MADVMTVLGPVAEEQLGLTLPHEHIYVDMLQEMRADGLLSDRRLMELELGEFVGVGGQTLVDCTSIGLGRDVSAVRDLAVATGLNIVVGTGFYRHPYLDRDWFDRNSVDRIAELLLAEIEDGIDGTGIRAGIIGEVGCDRYVSAAEERSLRAAARAHRRTGLVITTHAARWPVGRQQLDLLQEEDVDPRRVIIGHCDRVFDEQYHLDMARRGAFVQFDGIRPTAPYDIERAVRYVMNIVRDGRLEQVLLSHDVCLKGHLRTYGGSGYSFLFTDFAGHLRAAGLSDEEFRVITVDNPRRALAG